MSTRQQAFGRYRRRVQAAALLAVAALSACGKAGDKAAEAALSADGTQARVDLAAGQARISSRDAAGQITVAQVGNTHVTEAELGVPIYPGATARSMEASRVQAPDAITVTAAYDTPDDFQKVADFYRGKLRALADGQDLMDTGGRDTVALVLVNSQNGTSVNVSVGKSERGSLIHVMTTRSTEK